MEDVLGNIVRQIYIYLYAMLDSDFIYAEII